MAHWISCIRFFWTRYSTLPNELWIAGAGSGKTHKIITESVEAVRRGERVLVVTYTTNNQAELRARFVEHYGSLSENFVVKGLFTFYLEDLVRPYQRILFSNRISTIFFTETDPHAIPNSRYRIAGRAEQRDDGSINPLYYLTPCGTQAYSGLLAKLATRIAKMSKGAPAARLRQIYQKVYFDEVQDLVGWDYDVIKSLSKTLKEGICCVGDFRQTIYTTTFGHKSPHTSEEKLKFFAKELKFDRKTLPKNHRSIQAICDLSDTVPAGQYEKTVSGINAVPKHAESHHGIFVVMRSAVLEYLSAFQPQVLRWSSTTGASILPKNHACHTFGSSKGLGFDRVLIIPPEKHIKFIGGDLGAFKADKTEESRNKLYVAITRARYSLAFVVDDELAGNFAYPVWQSQPCAAAEA